MVSRTRLKTRSVDPVSNAMNRATVTMKNRFDTTPSAAPKMAVAMSSSPPALNALFIASVCSAPTPLSASQAPTSAMYASRSAVYSGTSAANLPMASASDTVTVIRRK